MRLPLNRAKFPLHVFTFFGLYSYKGYKRYNYDLTKYYKYRLHKRYNNIINIDNITVIILMLQNVINKDYYSVTINYDDV